MKQGRGFVMLALAALVGCAHGVNKEEDVIDLAPRMAKPMESRKRIAVADFENKTEYGQWRLGTQSADILTTYLFKAQQFRVVERKALDKVLDELKLQGTGVTDSATAVKVGKILGVEYIVYGAVTNFGYNRRGADFIVGSSRKQVAESTVDVRLIHVETGEICFADTGRGSASRSATKVMGAGGTMSFDETLAGDSLRASIVKFVDKLIDAAP